MPENNIVNSNAESQESSVLEETAATTNVPVKEKAPKVETAHDDFDWSIDKRNVASYTNEEKRSTTLFMKAPLKLLLTESW